MLSFSIRLLREASRIGKRLLMKYVHILMSRTPEVKALNVKRHNLSSLWTNQSHATTGTLELEVGSWNRCREEL